MKRYRVSRFDFDSSASFLGMEIREEWDEDTKNLQRKNKEQITHQFLEQYGNYAGEMKMQNLMDLGDLPISILAFHNKFLDQIRSAFIIGAYYPALTAACALGERILNHLILFLRDDFKKTPEYKSVYDKKSFDNWNVPINALKAWYILLPNVVNAFHTLSKVRNRAIHFSPNTDRNDRSLALEAIGLLTQIVSEQFSGFGPEPWFITNVPGEVYIKKEAEASPFIKKIYLPNCACVGPFHTLEYNGSGFTLQDNHNYEIKEITDEEFAELRKTILNRDA